MHSKRIIKDSFMQVYMGKGFGSSSDRKNVQPQGKTSLSAADAAAIQIEWLSTFSELSDPRGRKGIEHSFLSIVMIAILATIGGATGWEDIETYGESHEVWLGTFLALPNGIPHADTYRRVFERIDPAALEQCFQKWVAQIVSTAGAQVIPIDGKTVKGSYDLINNSHRCT